MAKKIDIVSEAEEILEEAVDAPSSDTDNTQAAGKAGSNADPAATAGGSNPGSATSADASDTDAEASPETESATESEPEPSLEDQLAAAQAAEQEWQDKFMRLHAEWDTYRRRTNEAREDEKLRATEGLVSDLLPVIDDFERSIDYAEQNGETGLLEGVKQVRTKLVEVLTKSGVETIDPVGEAFDALEAQAVAKVDDTSVPDETVAEVYQKGYRMGKKVLRPAMVTVTTGGPAREAEDVQDEDAE